MVARGHTISTPFGRSWEDSFSIAQLWVHQPFCKGSPMHRFSMFAAILSLSLLVGCNAPGGQPAVAVKSLDEKATAVRLQAVVYELRVAPEQLASFDAAR